MEVLEGDGGEEQVNGEKEPEKRAPTKKVDGLCLPYFLLLVPWVELLKSCLALTQGKGLTDRSFSNLVATDLAAK